MCHVNNILASTRGMAYSSTMRRFVWERVIHGEKSSIRYTYLGVPTHLIKHLSGRWQIIYGVGFILMYEMVVDDRGSIRDGC